MKNDVKERVIPAYLGKNCSTALYNTRKVSYTWPTFPAGFEEPWALNAYSTGLSGANSTLNVPSFWGREKLVGVTGDRTRFNDVYHSRFGLINLPHLIHYESGSPNYFNSANYLRSVFPPNAMLRQGDLNNLIAMHERCVVTPLMRNEAYGNMLPRFQSDANLLLTLFELKDFREVAETLFKGGSRCLLNEVGANVNLLKNKLAHYRDFITRDVNSKTAAGLRKPGPIGIRDVLSAMDPSKTVAGGWLTYQLAIRPTMMDFTNIMDALKLTVLEAQQKFSDLGRDVQTSHFTIPMEKIDERSICTPTNADWASEGKLLRCYWTATLKYKYDYRMRNYTDALAQYWGLYMTPETAWNAIPFSFLADYVLTISRSLRAMERDPNVDLLAVDYGESKKSTYCLGYSVSETFRKLCMVIDGKYYIDPKKLKNTSICGVEGTIYERTKREPGVGVVLPSFKAPNTRQLMNVAALARCFL